MSVNSYYNVLNKIKDFFLVDNTDKFRTITTGDIYSIDLSKQTIFPLAHIIVNNITQNEHTQTYNLSFLAMDIVDISKEEETDTFYGNNNEADILNTQLANINFLIESMRRGELFKDNFRIVEDTEVLIEPFYEKSENMLAGWSATMDVEVRNNILSDLC